ncbi:hypothetical protein N9165_02970 [Akkermansiaceae bacterium]|nr:hypothetical protein [Akkermansiaceae bacterium]
MSKIFWDKPLRNRTISAMEIKNDNHHRLIKGARILPILLLSAGALVISGCEKAPSAGEAFVTLKSDEIRFLADLEVSFYGADLGVKLKEFQVSLVDSAKAKARVPLEEQAAQIKAEIESAEAFKKGIDKKASEIAEEETTDAKNALTRRLSDLENKLRSDLSSADQAFIDHQKKLADEKRALNTKQVSLKRDLVNAEPKYNSLLSVLEPRVKREKELVTLAHGLGTTFYSAVSDLTPKINETIISEKIPTKQHIDVSGECKAAMTKVKARSTLQMVSAPSEYLPEKRSLPPNLSIEKRYYQLSMFTKAGLTDYEGSLVPIKLKTDYTKHCVPGFIVLTICPGKSFEENLHLSNYPSGLERSGVAKDIVAMVKRQESFCKSIIRIKKDLETNEKALDNNLRVWMNSNEMSLSQARTLLTQYVTDSRTLAAVPGQITAIEQKEAVPQSETKWSRADIETSSKAPIEKLKEEIPAFDKNIASYREDRYELAKKKMLSEVTSKLGELTADLQNANMVIEQINGANSMGALYAVDDIDVDLMPTDQTIGTINAFLGAEKIGSTRTGSGGQFAVPGEARYVMAYHVRESEKKELFWLIKINLEEDQVRLTNSNITNTYQRQDSDDIWRILLSDRGKSMLTVMELSFEDD